MNANDVLLNILLKNEQANSLRHDVLNRKPFLGISYPVLKQISKIIMASDPIQFLESNDFSIYELEILQTYVIGQIKDRDLGIKYFSAFAPFAKEWSVVDSLCQKFVIARKYPKEIFDLMKTFALIDDAYIQRIVSVTLLSHFLNDNTIDEAITLINQLDHSDYYCKMAKAWAYATMAISYPEKVITCLNQKYLDVWTHNKAIQKMFESRRVSADTKAKILLLKR